LITKNSKRIKRSNRSRGNKMPMFPPLSRDSYILKDDGRTIPMSYAFPSRGIGQSYVFQEQVNLSNFVSSSVSTQYLALAFQLTDISNYSTFTTLFDKFRILDVMVLFLPINNQLITDDSGSQQTTLFVTALDFDSATTPSSINAIQRYSTAKQTLANQPQLRHFRPRAALAAYSGSAFTSYVEAPLGTWLDAANAGVPHYGLVAGLTITSVTAQVVYAVRVRYRVEFAASR
jgi:hypothetical protein